MTTIKYLLCAFVLTVSLGGSALAGTISTTKAGTISTTKAGTISTTGTTSSASGTISTTRADSESAETGTDLYAFFAILLGTW